MKRNRVWGEWRKRVGIEPTARGISPEPDGFEGRASHQSRIASMRRRREASVTADDRPRRRTPPSSLGVAGAVAGDGRRALHLEMALHQILRERGGGPVMAHTLL